MKKVFKQTVIYGFCHYGFWLSVVLIPICCFLSRSGPSTYYDPLHPKTILNFLITWKREAMLDNAVFSALNIWKVSQFEHVAPLMAVIAALPCVLTYCDELRGGYYRFELIHLSRKQYIFGKVLGNCVCSGAAVFTGLVFAFIVFSICFPSIGNYTYDELFGLPETGTPGIIADLAEESKLVLKMNGFIYVLRESLKKVLFAAVVSIIPMTIATFFSNKYFVFCFSFMLSFFSKQFSDYISMLTNYNSKITKYIMSPYLYSSAEKHWLTILIYGIIFSLACAWFFKRRTSRA